MKIEIISTGEEVLTGAVVDENAAYIAQELVLYGFEITRHICVGDRLDALVHVIREAGERADAVVVTGGLGPTDDDRTAEAASNAFGTALEFNQEAERSVMAFFTKRNREIPETNKKQMFLPKGALCLLNDVGTAPGFRMDRGRCVFYFLPGVPSEMRHMMAVHVIPGLLDMEGADRKHFMMKTLSCFGLPEAEVDNRLKGIETVFQGVTLGLRAVFPVIQVKLYARGNSESDMTSLLNRAGNWCIERIGDYLFSVSGKSLEEKTGMLLREKKYTIAVAESCTGGLISHMLTGVPGSSDYFLFSGVTYSNASKVAVLGVNEMTLKVSGAVSLETVVEMAKGARAVSGADMSVATSGIAGPGGGSPEKPVGTVYIGIATENGCKGYRFQSHYKDREKNKVLFATKALDLVRRTLVGLDIEEENQ